MSIYTWIYRYNFTWTYSVCLSISFHIKKTWSLVFYSLANCVMNYSPVNNPKILFPSRCVIHRTRDIFSRNFLSSRIIRGHTIMDLQNFRDLSYIKLKSRNLQTTKTNMTNRYCVCPWYFNLFLGNNKLTITLLQVHKCIIPFYFSCRKGIRYHDIKQIASPSKTAFPTVKSEHAPATI